MTRIQIPTTLTAMKRITFSALILALIAANVAISQQQPTREQKVRGDKAKVEAAGFWIYNDLAKGVAEAKKSGQPLLVTLRCIPCVDCVKLDEELVETDPKLRPLLEKFVRVRIISANNLDLSLFQFDTDQSFAVFLLNADGAIYGRYGTRSDHSYWADDVSIEGLGKALEGALALHAAYPANKAELALKRGPAPDFPGAAGIPPAQRQVRGAAQLRRQRRAKLHPLPPGRRRHAAVLPRQKRHAARASPLPLSAPQGPGLDPQSARAGEREQG